MIPLDDMISFSISQIKDAELRKKMANSILLLGGTSLMSKIIEELEDRLIEKIAQYEPTMERIEVIDTLSREIMPTNMSWVGATVIPRLDSARDLWISRKRWIGEVDEIEEDEDEDEEKDEQNEKKVVSSLKKQEKSSEWGIR